MSKRKKYPLLEKVEIIDIGAEGKAIAKHNDKIIFIPQLVPGDIVDIQVNKKRKKYLEGYPVKFHKYSAIRTKPYCSHFGTCGGCKWQNLPYKEQLKYKQKQVYDQLHRIGKIPSIQLEKMNNIRPSEKTKYYRNKLEYTFSNNRWLTREEIDSGKEFPDMNALGFHVPGMFDKVIDLTECYHQPSPSNEIRNAVREFSKQNRLSYFDIKKQVGFLRNLIIRNTSSGQFMVIVSFFYDDKKNRELLLEYISSKFPMLTSLMYVINSKKNDTITDQDIKLFKGKDHIIEEMEGLKFKVSPKSFYQTNSAQAYELYKKVRKFADLKGNELIYDLYTGTGTIACFIASGTGHVIGIDSVPEAIEDARKNSQLNELDNIDFYTGDIKDIFNNEFITENGKPDVLILDPPRAGVHKDVIENIRLASPEKIIYVSCNPATQARDISFLLDKYEVVEIQPVDMFPQTHHVENIVLLIRK
ncbi:MAG: 23S rRNA (uracil(1939)-C(5))-methyltransferase RlmD [Bacteroidales bacterium]|nr:23S rRNA (uracil(1939)-C(5))-methyltransferase RlmD [Bacteroidales bacterium]